MRIILRALAAAVLTVISVPLILTVVYGFMDPPSLPIMRRQAEERPAVQDWRPLSEISPTLVRAVVMAEDARFCLHWGVDLAQMRIVLQDALDGQPPRGASTITMQVVKNLFLWPERDYLRKAVEIPLAFWMDLVLSKDRILEIYLNIAQWGPSIYGAEAAAQHYFGIPAARLSREQAVALATILPAPGARDPRNPGRRHRAVIQHVNRELERAPWVFTCLPSNIRP
ncbi:monofunctional biosynthetic peptidoglycan transglycosylase [Acuticoccus sp. M5D2P5]|uniref:monofunctional biosynthetic peptidoglycan transglycosylase n=1 Tax=Acuticoccus kalidii TaxID=2910977 RepID=UPI001F3EAF70|nr:monofunctional biosynthetic peptidoglycan transglycosylase [Acuticoccus kalidii]